MTTKTLTSPTVAALLGCSKQTVYDAARNGGITLGEARIVPMVVGRRVIWPAAPIREALGMTEDVA